jgi:uroporphyrinogen-III synthase
MRTLLLLRPEPGLQASVERAEALGLDVIACPLFRIEPVEWDPPDPANYDALLLTSANAVRCAGPGLNEYRHLPVHAVGPATAAAASEAGLNVAGIGWGGVDELLAALPRSARLLRLAGEDRSESARGHSIDVRTVYRAATIADPALPPLARLVAAVHSPRAGARFAALSPERSGTSIAAISASAALACGEGWERIETAVRPDDESLLALAATLCHTSPPK